MSNILFGWPIYSDVSVLYTPDPTFGGANVGGSWSSALPLTNLQDSRLTRVARSASAAVADTRFAIYLGVQRTGIKVVAIPKHTISPTGTVRARIYNSGPTLFGIQLDFGTGWSVVGTPTRTPAAFTGSDGVPLDLIGDDAAGALEGYTRVVPWTTSITKFVSIRVKQGTSTSSVIRVRDTTVNADRLLGVLTWSGGLPVLTMSTGTLIGYTTIGGEFRLGLQTTAITAASVNQVEVYPATTSGLATGNTGDLYCGDLDTNNSSTDILNYDSGYVTPFPAGLTAEDVVGLNVPFAVFPPSVAGAEVLIEINDTTNPEGFIDLARLIVAGGLQPAVNMDYGAGIGAETDTVVNRTDGGSALFDERPLRRTMSGSLSHLTDAEALGQFFTMRQQCGISRQLFVAWDPADTTYLHKRAFLAVFKDVSAIDQPYLARHQTAFSLVEEL